MCSVQVAHQQCVRLIRSLCGSGVQAVLVNQYFMLSRRLSDVWVATHGSVLCAGGEGC